LRKLIPVLLLIVGLFGGAGAGLFLKPVREPEDKETVAQMTEKTEINIERKEFEEKPEEPLRDYVKLNNQFVVPIIKDGRVVALVVMSLSVEVLPDSREEVFAREPKLRDIFLQVLFDHANAGGFDGNFTSSLNMSALRSGLLDVAKSHLGNRVTDILISDIIRQDGS
jgi:flagellar FliL protein